MSISPPPVTGRLARNVIAVCMFAGAAGLFGCAGEVGGHGTGTGGTTPGSAGAGGAPSTTGASGGTTGTGGISGGAGALGGTGGRAGGTGGSTGSAGGTPGGAGGTTGGVGGALGGGGVDGTAICARWTADRANLSEGTWSGATATLHRRRYVGRRARECVAPGQPLSLARGVAAGHHRSRARRRGSGLRAHDARQQHDLAHAADDLALLHGGRRRRRLELERLGGPAVSSVDLYMTDPGNPTTIGHRRWLLSNSLGPIGIGGTDRSSCLWTLTGTGKAGKPWMAWPPAGIVPVQAVFAGDTKGGADTTGWTVESDSINLANAQVTVTLDGANMPVTVAQLLGGYGSKYAISFIPMGWTTQPDKTYSVAITGD